MTVKMLVARTLLLSASLTLGLQAQPVHDVLDLDEAIEIALARHGSLDAARAAVEARAGSTRQAGRSPNPVFTLQTENWRFYGEPAFQPSRALDVFAWVNMPIETAGKRRRRVEVAEADAAMAEQQRQLVAWTIRQRVKKTYWQALAAIGDVEMLERSRETLQRMEDYHEVRVRLGAMAEAQLVRVRVDAGRAALALSTAEMEVGRAKLALLESMGAPDLDTRFALTTPRAQPVRTSLKDGLSVQQIIADALVHRMEIQIGRSLLRRARADVALQRSLARPDVMPFLGYKRTNAFNTLLGGVSVALPVRDRNGGNIEEALAEVRRQEALVQATEARVRTEVARAVETVRRRADMLLTMKTGILDGVSETSRIALAAHQQAGTALLDVLDAQRLHDEVRLFHSRSVFDYELNWVDLETAIGASIVSISPQGDQAVPVHPEEPVN